MIDELEAGFVARLGDVVHLVGGLFVEVGIASGLGVDVGHGEVLDAGFFHAFNGFGEFNFLHAVDFPVAGDEGDFDVAGDGLHPVLLDERQERDEVLAAGTFDFLVADLGDGFDDLFGLLHESAADGVELDAEGARGFGKGAGCGCQQGQGGGQHLAAGKVGNEGHRP